MKDRIRQLMECRQLTQQNFADMLKISPASLSSIFNERTKPTLNHVEAIHNAFPDINLQWLLYGEGEMFEGHEHGSSDATGTSFTQPQGQEQSLLFDSAPTSPMQSDGIKTGYNQQRQLKQPEVIQTKIIDKTPRQISEIRIFYDDQTWETFVPKK